LASNYPHPCDKEEDSLCIKIDDIDDDKAEEEEDNSLCNKMCASKPKKGRDG
jgi:hypothetical protein